MGQSHDNIDQIVADFPAFSVLFADDVLYQSLIDTRAILIGLFAVPDDLTEKFVRPFATLLHESTTEGDISPPDIDDPSREGLRSGILALLRQMYRADAFMNPIFMNLVDVALQLYDDPLSADELKQVVEIRTLKEVLSIDHNYNDDILRALVAFGRESEAVIQANKRRNLSERVNSLYAVYASLHQHGKDTKHCIDLIAETAHQIDAFSVLPRLALDMSFYNLDDTLHLITHIADPAERDNTLLEIITRLSADDDISSLRLLDMLNMIDDWTIHAHALVPICLSIARDDVTEASRIADMRKSVIESLKYFLEFRLSYPQADNQRKADHVFLMLDFARQIQHPLIKSVALAETAHLVLDLENYGWEGSVHDKNIEIEGIIPDLQFIGLNIRRVWSDLDANIDNATKVMGTLISPLSEIPDTRLSTRLIVRFIRPFAERDTTIALELLSKVKNRGLVTRIPLALIKDIAETYPENALALIDGLRYQPDQARAYTMIATAYVNRNETDNAQKFFDIARDITAQLTGENKSKLLAYLSANLLIFNREDAEALLTQAKQQLPATQLSQILRDNVVQKIAHTQITTNPDFAHALAKQIETVHQKGDVYRALAQAYPERLPEFRAEFFEYLNAQSMGSRVPAQLKFAEISDDASAKTIFNECLKIARSNKNAGNASRSLQALAIFTSDDNLRWTLFTEAESRAKQQRDYYDQDSLLGHIAFEKSRFDLDKGLTLARSIREPRFRTESLIQIAVDQFKQTGIDGDLLKEARKAIHDLNSDWLESNAHITLMPVDIALGKDHQDILDAITYEQSKATAYTIMAKHTLTQNIDTALSYLDNITAENQRNSALSSVIIELSKINTQKALELLDRITDPRVKSTTQRLIAVTYFADGAYHKALVDVPPENPEIYLGVLTNFLPESLPQHYPEHANLFLELMHIALDTLSRVQQNWKPLYDILVDNQDSIQSV